MATSTGADSATLHRDLRTGRPVWCLKRRPSLDVGALSRAIRCEVIVVGAGISGALIAESLTDAGLDVVIVDRRRPIDGSTAASTALLQYALDTPLHLMARRIGRERAERIWRRSRLAVDALRERSERLGIAGASRTSIYLDGNMLDAKGLAAEARARRRAGFEVELIGPAETEARYGIRRRHAIVGFGDYVTDPVRMAAGYLNAACARGARLYSPVDIADIHAEDTGVTLRTTRGIDIAARHVVFATGYEMLRGVPRKGNRILSTWCIATRPQPRALWPGEALIWEASDPYLYVRAAPDGAVICGGEDEAFDDEARRDARIGEKAARLAAKLGRLLPDIDPTPVHAWAGSFGSSPVGTPTIGRVPHMPNCYAAMGYGGNGITFSMMAAQILRGAICGYGDADANLFSFHRKF